MKFSFLFSLFSLSPKKSIIENGAYPLCKNCIYYRPNPLDILTQYQYGKCTKYGTKEVVSGYICYDFADLCRRYEEKCGKTGKDYIVRPDFFTLINNTIQVFTDKSSKDKYLCEKIRSIPMEDYKPIEKETEKETEREIENCASEEEDCSTEFCNECYSENCKKKSTKIIDKVSDTMKP